MEDLNWQKRELTWRQIIGVVQSEEQEEKRMKNKEVYATPSRVHIIGVSEGKKKGKNFFLMKEYF